MSTVAVEQDLEALIGNDDPWHLAWSDESEYALCGVLLVDALFVPGDEVPDEDTCKSCLKIRDGLGLDR